MSSLKAVVVMLCRSSGCLCHLTWWKATPTAIVPRTPSSIDAFTRSACKIAINRMPNNASSVVGLCRSPSVTTVAGLRHDNAGVLQPDKGDEKPDASRNRSMQFMRNRPNQSLAECPQMLAAER